MPDKLDIGCADKRPDGYMGLDIQYFEYPDKNFVVADLNDILPFDDNSFTEVRAMYVLEHLYNDKKISFMNEIYRILKPQGNFVAAFPPPIMRTGSPSGMFYCDPTHYAYWMPGTFSCFSKEFRDKSNSNETYEKGYGIKASFEVAQASWVDDYIFYVVLSKE